MRHAELVAALEAVDAPTMRRLIINEHYNKFCREYCDGTKDDDEKVIPYMGWFWRNTNFADKRIPIGFYGGHVGIMENNKWDYPERYMTTAEADQLIALLDDAIIASRQGGELSKITENTWAAVRKIKPWMFSLPRVLEPA
jgi:hypothetical protein